MAVRLPTYAVILLLLVLVSSSACNRGSVTMTAPNTTTNLKATLASEPESVRPQFLTDLCPSHPAFGVRLTVIVGGEDLIVRGVRFGFFGRTGTHFVPHAFLTTLGSTTIPSTSAVPFTGTVSLPNSSPIPIPGAPAIHGVRVNAGDRLALPFFLRFGCGVLPEGSIVVTVDTSDTIGRFGAPELTIPLRP
jgi:hypothetical protein